MVSNVSSETYLRHYLTQSNNTPVKKKPRKLGFSHTVFFPHTSSVIQGRNAAVKKISKR